MTSDDYGDFQNSDMAPFESALFGQIPDLPFYTPNPCDAYSPVQSEAIIDPYQAFGTWGQGLGVSQQWDDVSTVTNPSSNTNTASSLSDLGSSDNDISAQVAPNCKRPLELVCTASPNKRAKSANGRAHTTHTAMNRKIGACLSCQMRTNKHRCKPGPGPADPCEACKKKGNSLAPPVCRRARFQDIKIIRLGPSRDFANTLRWLKDPKTPQDPQKGEWKKLTNLSVKKCRQGEQGYKELRLSQAHSRNTLDLRVQEFDPVENDKTDYVWFDNDGVGHVYKCPHYAIADREHATDQVRRFIDSNVEQYVNNLLPATNDPSSEFVRMAFRHALDRARESSLVALTIRFWVAGRLIEDPWSIQGNETLGMELDPLPGSPYSQRIPVTPIMDFQIDNIVIYDYLISLLDRIRNAMKGLIMPRKEKDWFDIHLATFLLLHHVDLTVKHDVEFAKSRCPSKRFSNRPLIEMITFGANSLLSFHQHEKGHFPLSARDWSEVERGHSFDESQRSYVLEARRLIQRIETPSRAGEDLFWTSQIYDRAWQPARVVVC